MSSPPYTRLSAMLSALTEITGHPPETLQELWEKTIRPNINDPAIWELPITEAEYRVLVAGLLREPEKLLRTFAGKAPPKPTGEN